jgi:hypothetical protein
VEDIMGVRDLSAPSAIIVAVLFAMLPLLAEASDEKAAVGSNPGYPTGASYEAFTATLPGLGLLSDRNGDGAVNDDRCNVNGKSELALVQGSLQVLIAAGILCNLAPSGPPLFLQEACFGGVAIAAATLQGSTIVISQCQYHDGLVQSAEITASFQNTRHMLATRLEEDLLTCHPLMSLRLPQADGGRAEEVLGLVKLRIDQYVAAGLVPLSASKARDKVASAEADFAAGRFPQAYAHSCEAYNILSAAN